MKKIVSMLVLSALSFSITLPAADFGSKQRRQLGGANVTYYEFPKNFEPEKIDDSLKYFASDDYQQASFALKQVSDPKKIKLITSTVIGEFISKSFDDTQINFLNEVRSQYCSILKKPVGKFLKQMVLVYQNPEFSGNHFMQLAGICSLKNQDFIRSLSKEKNDQNAKYSIYVDMLTTMVNDPRNDARNRQIN